MRPPTPPPRTPPKLQEIPNKPPSRYTTYTSPRFFPRSPITPQKAESIYRAQRKLDYGGKNRKKTRKQKSRRPRSKKHHQI